MNIHSGPTLSPSIAATIPPDGFTGTRVLVVGDLMLDRYIIGDVTRISPEAPVPVLTVKGERVVAGGAGNVALNIAGLKARAILAGVVGEDPAAQRLLQLLAEHEIEVSGVVSESTRPTTCKTRVMCGNHQIVRMDEESVEALTTAAGDELFQKVISILDEGCHSVILSDYAKGVLGAGLTRKVIAACSSRSIPVLVDPKRSDYTPYSGATCITPNLREFKAASIAIAMEEHEMSVAGFELLNRLQCKTLLVTQGAEGMTLFTGEHSYHFPALAEEVFDVSGAGDTVISTVATALGSGLEMLTAVQLSNIAASLVVRKAGTAPVRWDDLSEVIFRDQERHDAVSSFGHPKEVAV